MEALIDDFPGHREKLYELKDLLFKLNRTTQVKGFIKTMGGQKDLVNQKNERPIPLSEAVTKFNTQKTDLLRLKRIVEEVRIDYVYVIEPNSIWVIVYGGGVLGSDFGYMFLEGEEVTSYSEKTLKLVGHFELTPIPGEKNWYVIVY